MVDNINGKWIVSGVLDWEFSFSGTILWDIANMLRYSFKTPKNFKTSFINGLTDNNILLPSDWNKSIKLLNLISLIDLLIRTNAKNHPKMYADIVLLINNIIGY